MIKLDFTSPILTSGSAITRYMDKEDGAEYIYSLFVPSDASTAFPVFDQPDLKAKFELTVDAPSGWAVVSNDRKYKTNQIVPFTSPPKEHCAVHSFNESKPFSTYVFAFVAGPFEEFVERDRRQVIDEILREKGGLLETDYNNPKHVTEAEIEAKIISVYVRKSQAAKFKPHAAEVFRLNREAIKYFEEYFDYKFPFPKYDLVLIPEFPFGGMEHAGATFLRESAVIFQQEPTKNDLVSRATLIFHEAAHQWFGDTVTMRWFDDLWLKEGFATFTAYKAMERIMPEMNAWKVFYERVKQPAYQTDSTRGTTPIYQEIKNLSAAKSAYGPIVYNKAPAFLRQAEFYLGSEDFQKAVRSFLKKHEFSNAGWPDLIAEFTEVTLSRIKTNDSYAKLDHAQEKLIDSTKKEIVSWSEDWVKRGGVSTFSSKTIIGIPRRGELFSINNSPQVKFTSRDKLNDQASMRLKLLVRYKDETLSQTATTSSKGTIVLAAPKNFFTSKFRAGEMLLPDLVFPNYQDHGYGIFLLDEKSRDYVLKNIRREKDPFLRAMMWGSLWDSVREGELDPREYVELVVGKSDGFSHLSETSSRPSATQTPKGVTLTQGVTLAGEDESTIAMLLSRTATAMSYYLSDAQRTELGPRVEEMLIERMRNAPGLGQRITYYRAFLNAASSEKARGVLKEMLAETYRSVPLASASGKDVANTERKGTGGSVAAVTPPAYAGGTAFPLKTKDKFDIVTRLLILGDPEAEKLLAELEKTETSDDAKRYAYAARAGIATAENKAKYWNDFVNNKEISESWIEASFGPWNSIRHSELTLPYLRKALQELPNHKRSRKIFFVNGWLAAYIGGQRGEEALAIVNKFLADNPNLDKDLRLKILETADLIERAVRIRKKYGN